MSPFSFSLTSYLKFIQEGRQKNTTAAKITRWESFLAGTRVLRFSCSRPPPPLLPHPQLVALSSREAFVSLVPLEERPARGDLSVMRGSCPAGTGPRRSPGRGSTALGGLARCSGPTTGTADTRSLEMQRSARRRQQLLMFRFCQSNKFCIRTKQCMLQIMQYHRVFLP